MSRIVLTLLMVVLFAAPAAADRVVPSERVKSRLMVRDAASREGRPVGGLRPGDEAELIASVEGWHQIRLPDGGTGYVSAGWSRVVPSPAPEPEPLPEIDPYTLEARLQGGGITGTMLDFLRATVLRPFTDFARVEFVIRHPELGEAVRRHYDPTLPVSGYATTFGTDARFDIMLVIDTSPSTNEFAVTDVDGDALAEDEWKGVDSIVKAQTRAARNFVRALKRLPGNHEGRRIRVGVVSFAGDERYWRRAEDEDFDPTPFNLLRLASRDAQLVVPLTGNYDLVEERLRVLGDVAPVGMTNFAAGITRAMVELEGLGPLGAESTFREDTQKVVQFMSDGKPRLPYDRKTAERATRWAAKYAGQLGIHINAFELGKNVVTRESNETLKKVARQTGGRFTALEHPADIVSILESTKFSFVDRVKLRNRTTGEETDYIATAIDGSFYGEIPLAEGMNDVELIAVLPDDRRGSEKLQIEFQRVPREDRLSDQLASIRQENEALIAQLKDQIAREMDEARAVSARGPQERTLEIRAEEVGTP